MIDPLNTWISTLANLPKVSDNSWCDNFANWVNDRVTAKAQLSGITTAIPPFTFNKATFKSQLLTIQNANDKTIAANNFANAWQIAVNASTLLINSGDFQGSPSPATTWSIVSLHIINSASILAAKNILINGIINASLVSDVNNSDFPNICRNAFLALKGDIQGLNSISPTPTPLIALGISFL